jgi:hypothetical protein
VKNKLSLKTERLAELTTDDLFRVHGQAAVITPLCINTLHGCTTARTCP